MPTTKFIVSNSAGAATAAAVLPLRTAVAVASAFNKYPCNKSIYRYYNIQMTKCIKEFYGLTPKSCKFFTQDVRTLAKKFIKIFSGKK